MRVSEGYYRWKKGYVRLQEGSLWLKKVGWAKKKAVLPGGKGPSLKSEDQNGTDYCNSTMLETSSNVDGVK